MKKKIDLDKTEVRSLNEELHSPNLKKNISEFLISNPNGKHAIAVGINTDIKVAIDGHVGYYCAGMNKHATVEINGHCGAGVAENMMSGVVWVKGDASQYAGATAHGGLLVVEGNTSSRCGISMKGVNIVIKGNVGHMSAFMAQKGCLVVCGDAGDALGESLYEAKLYIRGNVSSLGADCIEKPIDDEHKKELQNLLEQAHVSNVNINEFKRYGSARKLYNFAIDNIDAY